jgi:Flp pilus assembly protein TadB
MGIEIAIAAAAAAAAAAGTGYAVYAGERADKAQKQALGEQRQAQQQASAQAASQQRRSAQRMAAANRRQPNMPEIMAGATEGAGGGPTSTMLTGPTGVNPQDLALGRSSLLGG